MGNIDFNRKLSGRLDEFRLFCRQSLDHRDRYWAGQARQLKWKNEFTTVVQEDFYKAEVSWFGGGRLNPTENALHRIIEKGMGEKTALISYDGAGAAKTYTFSQLKDEVLKLSAAFHQEGLRQGDCIALNLPNCPEFVICVLAAAYIGVTYLPIGCHLPAALVADHVNQSRAKLLILADDTDPDGETPRVETVHSLLDPLSIITVGEKFKNLPTLEEYVAHAGTVEPAYPDADHPLFAIYENRLAGQPVGAVFATGGFLVQACTSFDLIFNKALGHAEAEIVFNTLDPSKAACQAYGIWGPLANGVGIAISGKDTGIDTIEALLEGQDRAVMICQPGLLSQLQQQMGETPLNTGRRFSVIACCGGALPPRLVNFAAGVLVSAQEHLVNLWVQNRCGTALIHTYPTPELNRPGSLGFGAPGVEPLIMNDFGQICKTNISGNLVFARSWPAMGRPTRGSEIHFKTTYFSRFDGCFETYDGLRRDPDGFHWFMGRLDDVIKVKGQTLATSQIESMLISHMGIDEAVIVNTKRESMEQLVAFVVTAEPIKDEALFIDELKAYIAEKIGGFAVPEKIVITEALPRTGTGKLVRRLLKRIASGEAGDNEDTSHLANAKSVKALIKKHKE